MDTTVFLIRHGENVYPTDDQGRRLVYGADAPLTPEGKIKIEKFAERLLSEGHRMERIYTSPYLRSLETAQINANIQKLPEPIVVDDFREIENSKSMGVPVQDVITGKFPWPIPEEYEAIATRMKHGLHYVVEREDGYTVGIVSHGDPIRSLIFRLTSPGTPMPTAKELFATDYIDKGEAWRLVVDKSLNLVEREYIGRSPEQFGKGERHW